MYVGVDIKGVNLIKMFRIDHISKTIDFSFKISKYGHLAVNILRLF